MARFARRVAPLLFFLLLLLAVTTSAIQTPEQEALGDTHGLAAESDDIDTSHEGTSHEPPLAENVRDAMEILRKIKPPSISKLAHMTRRPKGFLGTIGYYTKQAFILLFMNGPKQSSSFTAGSEAKSVKLSAPLSKAVQLLEEAAGEYNGDAMYLLAELNFYGNHTHPVNYTQAFKWYSELADFDGNSTAQYMLGFIHATGLDPERPADLARSMLYHTFAAEQGNTRSEMTLAYRHHEGIGTSRNCNEAVHWYKRVADKAIRYYRSGPPGGYSLVKEAYRIADKDGGVYGEGASASSSGLNAKTGGPTSDAYASVEDVLEYLHLQSSKGELGSTFGLARLHYDGARGLKPDWKLAKKNFLIVAREYWPGDGKVNKGVSASTERLASKAAGYLGRMFLRGEGMAQDFNKALRWFQRGTRNGDALSQYSLGVMYLEGLGVPKDAIKAAQYFTAAADQDLAVAQTNLGMLFLDQDDTHTAVKYFELAARNSHIEAFYYLAEMSDKGIGRDRSCGMAAGYYKVVAEKAEAIWGTLGEANAAYDDGDMSTAVRSYLMAAEQGSEAAQANVAWLLDQSQPRWSPFVWLFSLTQSARVAVSDAVLALMYWTRSAKQKNVDSLVKMGDYYLAGLGAVVSAENAAACYQAAADTLQSAQAMWNLGWMHENGIGIVQDFHLAKRYYDQALETNKEAYLPVKMSLFRLRWRSWWNDITHGDIKGIQPEESARKPRSFAEWLNEFLENDASEYYGQAGHDGWSSEHDLAGGDDIWDAGGVGDDIDDGVLETLLIGGLIAALGWLVYYRQQRRRAAEEQRRAGERPAVEGGAPPGEPAAVAAGGGQAGARLPGQQPDGGFFPQPGDPNYGAWVAGGIGI